MNKRKNKLGRKLLSFFLAMTMLIGLMPGMSQKAHADTAAVSVTGVTLNKTSTTLVKGKTETLTATVAPDDVTDKSVKWSSDNTAVATVNNGVVTAVHPVLRTSP